MNGIGIENFRVFKDPAYFLFPGITALIGPNSSGKSSLLKLLKLFQENTKDSKIPSGLDFRGSDHYLGNFDYAISRNSIGREISIALPHTLFDFDSLNAKNVIVRYQFVEDGSNRKLKNAILNKVEVISKNPESDGDLVFRLDSKFNDFKKPVQLGEIRPLFNTQWICTNLHATYDSNLIKLYAIKFWLYSNDSDSQPRYGTLKAGYEEYVKTKLSNLGYRDILDLEEEEVKTDFKAIVDYLTQLKGVPAGYWNGAEPAKRIFTKDIDVLKEFVAKSGGDFENEINRTELCGMLYPGDSSCFFIKVKTRKRITIFSYPELLVILSDFSAWQNEASENKEGWIRETLKNKLDFSAETIETILTSIKIEDIAGLDVMELVAYYRQRDIYLMNGLLGFVSLIYLGYSTTYNKLVDDDLNWGDGFVNMVGLLKEVHQEFNFKNIGKNDTNSAVAIKETLNDLLNALKTGLSARLSNHVVSLSWTNKEFKDLKKIDYGYFFPMFDGDLENNSLKNKDFSMLLKDLMDLSEDIFKPLFDVIQNFEAFKFTSLNSSRGSADRVYSDQDLSTEWRKIVFDLADISTKQQEFINIWVKEFGIADRLSVVRGKEAASSRVLLDHEDTPKRKAYSENLSDLGFGISQMLPIICKIALASEDSFIVLEEPEANLHPAYQSKLADLFVAANKEFGHKFLLETHSEYLVRKLQVLVARGEFDNEKANVYYFNPEGSDEKQKIKEINFTTSGGLTDSFGPGFFEESGGLKMELLSLKNQSN